MNRTLLTTIVISLLAVFSFVQPAFAQANQPNSKGSAPQSSTQTKAKRQGKKGTQESQEGKEKKGKDEQSTDSDDSDDSTTTPSNNGGFGGLKLQSPFATSGAAPSDSSDSSTTSDDSSDSSDSDAAAPSETAGGDANEGAASSESTTPAAATPTANSENTAAGAPTQVVETEEVTDFEPLPEVEEGALELILPGSIHPRFDFKGYFRTRIDMPVNYDLDTTGTSAILPVLDSVGSPAADPEKSVAISTNMRFHIEPTLVITDELRIHSEFDILDNVVFGDSPVRSVVLNSYRPELYSPLTNSTQFSVADSIKIRELYGVVDTLFGSLYIGRMDNNFGLGIQDNDGDGIDGDYGSNVDSIKASTHVFGLTTSFSVDFPDEGISTQRYRGPGGVAYDLAQVDDADQYTLQIAYAPSTEQERLLEQRTLQHDGVPIANAALQFRYRGQDGVYSSSPAAIQNFPNTLPNLVYKGLSVYSFDAWVKMIHNPNDDFFARLELEAFTNFGGVANVTEQPVGQATSNLPAVNCFKTGTKDPRCSQRIDGSSASQKFVQWGLALESEFRIGQLASWGLNLGVASGGKTPNWGTSGELPDYNFAQFNRDYHVDLILFRNIIGTVTNAAYFKPYVHFEFLRAGNRHLEGDVSSIISMAVNKEGTPSGDRMLGTEFDAAFRYILKDQLSAGFEGGILFPFAGLNAVAGRQRYVRYQSRPMIFTENKPARIAWTLQGKFVWMF